MTTYFNDCSSLTGWSDAALTAGTQFSVSSGTIVASAFEILSLDAVDSDANRETVEILLKYKTSAWNSTHYIGVARGSDSDTSGTSAGYYVALRSTAIRTYYKNSGGSLTQISSTTLSTLSADTYYWLRLRCNSTTIQARTWADGGSEPGTWDCDATDTSGPGVVDGYVGLYAPNASTHTWDAFGVGTNGDTAPSSAGGGGATITGDSGSYTLTGTAATLKVGRKLTADSGTYSLTGTDVAFKRGYALSAESGTYTVSGTAVDLKAGRKLTADSGSYTLTGTDVTLNYSPAGSYNLTAESGTYTLTGTAATLKVSRKLTADSGAYPLTGTDVTLSKGVKLTADSGSYTLSGSNVAFSRTYVLTAESGAYTLTGTSAGLTWSGAPVVEAPTNGGPSIYGKPVFREKQFRKEYEEQVKRIEDEKRLARILREDEEITVIMALMAA